MNLKGNGKVLVAMSGGIDSSVAALLLKEQGWKVYGLTLRMWDYLLSDCKAKETGCCSIEAINDAKLFSEQNGFEHHIIDCRKEFLTDVAENFQSEYLNGRTPNPCVVCNKQIKWNFMLKIANELGCDFVSTGHYANAAYYKNRYFISKGIDNIKDQSYFLWALDQESIARTIFPLGNMYKEEIRKYAENKGLKKLREKKESMEVCFIQSGNYRDFISKRIEGTNLNVSEGNFIDKTGKILGKHKGYPYYTVGQRKGLGIAVGTPLYVTKINPEKNEVQLGFREDLSSFSLKARNVNLMKYASLDKPQNFLVKIRYKNKGNNAMVSLSNNILNVEFIDEVYAVAPGQSVVAYENNDIVAAGIIM